MGQVSAARLLSVALALLALLPASAAAGFRQLYHEYRASGSIGGCGHSHEELSRALAEVPADIEAYDPEFTDALNAALEQRAVGCGGASLFEPGGSVAGAGAGRAEDGSPGPRNPRAPPDPGLAEVDSPSTSPALALGGLAALGVVLVAVAFGSGGRPRRGAG